MSLSRRSAGVSSQNQAGRRNVRIIMLDRKELIINVENKGARVVDVFNQVCQHVSLNETHYFGLALLKVQTLYSFMCTDNLIRSFSIVDGEFQFVANDTKLHKLAPKIWKSKDCLVDEPLLTFYFRVQFYVDNISLLKERPTRLQYYLQLRDNLLHYNQSVTEEKCFMLAGYALQAEHGNFDVDKHTGTYFDPREFFPAWVVMRRGQDYLTNHMPTIHRDLSGMSRAEACVQYIREVSMPPAPHNMHFYRLRRSKYDPLPGNAWLAICPKGLEVYQEVNDFKTHYSTFLWPHIGKLSCEKKKFEIVAEGFAERRFVYFAASKESGEALLNICRATHQFHLSQQPLVAELCRLADRDRHGPGHVEKYVYSECADYASSLSREQRSASDRSRASSIPASGGRDRDGSGRMVPQSHSARGASSPPAASGFFGGTPVTSSRDVDSEIMIDSPPQSFSSSVFTKITPISSDLPSTLWTPPSYYIPPGVDSQRAFSGIEMGDQRPSLSASSSVASLKAVGRGSFVRSSASSTDGSGALGPGGRVPLSLPKSDVAYGSPILHAPAAHRSGQAVSAPMTSLVVNARSLQRNLRPGECLNDTVDKILEGDPAALRSVPPRKSSLVYPRTSALQSSDASVTRSTSLRQTTSRPTTDADDDVWPSQQRLTSAPAQSNLNLALVPVEAHIQRIPFAAPMTVISNPVQSGVAIQPPPSSSGAGSIAGRMTPPYQFAAAASEYRHVTPNDSSSFAVGPFHSTPILRPQYQHAVASVPPLAGNLLSRITNDNFVGHHQFADSADDSNASVEPAELVNNPSNFYNMLPSPAFIYGDVSQQQQQQPIASNDAVVVKQPFVGDEAVGAVNAAPTYKQPPSYEASQSYKLTAAMATPPTNHHYIMNDGTASAVRKTNYFADPTNGGVVKSEANRDTSTTYFPNGMLHVNGSSVGHQLAQQMSNFSDGHEGKLNGFIASGAPLKQLNTPMSRSAANQGQPPRLATQPQRQASGGSADDNPSVRCPQHGSGLDIVEMVRSIDAPMLKALCNDRTLLSSCTCRQPTHFDSAAVTLNGVDSSPPSNHSSARRMSLTQTTFNWDQYDQPGTVVRPNSWSSEHQAARLLGLQLTNVIDIDGGPDSPSLPYANGFDFHRESGGGRGRGLVHRHSDGSSFQHHAALMRHGQNHSDTINSPPNYIAA